MNTQEFSAAVTAGLSSFWTWCVENKTVSIPVATLLVGVIFGLYLAS